MIATPSARSRRPPSGWRRGTLADFTRAMQALGRGDLDAAHARVDIEPVHVRSRDEVGRDGRELQPDAVEEVGRATVALDGAREGLRDAQGNLKRNVDQQAEVVALGQRALEGVEPVERLMEETVRRCVREGASRPDARCADRRNDRVGRPRTAR